MKQDKNSVGTLVITGGDTARTSRYVSQAEKAAVRAEQSAAAAEAWAVGESGGIPVGSTDETFHNNARHFAEHAAASAASTQIARTAAESAANAAQSAKDDAEAAAQSVSQSAAQISQNASDISDLKSASILVNSTAQSGISIATLGPNTVTRVTGGTDRPADVSASSGFSVITIKVGASYTQIGFYALNGKTYIRYAGSSKEYSEWICATDSLSESISEVYALKAESILVNGTARSNVLISTLDPNTFVRIKNANDRPSDVSATTNISVITTKVGTAYTQIAIAAMTGKVYIRYAGSSKEYSAWKCASDAVKNALEESLNDYEEKKHIKILCIGNSFTQDNIDYAPFILDSIMPDVHITLGIACYGGASIDDYISLFNNNTANVTYNKKAYDSTEWVETKNKTIKQIVSDKDWDIITFQQSSGRQESWSNYTNLNTLIDDIVTYYVSVHSKPVKLGWFMPQIRLTTATADSYSNLVQCVQNVLATTPIDFLFPCGTAIQNARGTALNSLGDSEYHGLTYDGAHLQEGLPCLIGAYVCAIMIMQMCGNGYIGIAGDTTRPIQEWITAKSIPGQNGASVGVTDANCYLAQKCAIAAVKKPFEVTAIT